MSNVVLYSATGCPLCAKYKTLLDELAKKGIRMVPTVFVGDKYVAGFRRSTVLKFDISDCAVEFARNDCALHGRNAANR